MQAPDTFALLTAILQGLRYWYQCDLTNPNWWHNMIGAPTMLGDILLCIKPVCELPMPGQEYRGASSSTLLSL